LCGEAREKKASAGCSDEWLFLALLALGTLGHRFALVAEVLMVAIFVAILVEFMRPQLQLRKPLPKPEIELKINDPSN